LVADFSGEGRSCQNVVTKINNIIERLNKESKRRTKPMEILAGGKLYYTLLAIVCLKTETQKIIDTISTLEEI
jgi:transposase-like protein